MNAIGYFILGIAAVFWAKLACDIFIIIKRRRTWAVHLERRKPLGRYIDPAGDPVMLFKVETLTYRVCAPTQEAAEMEAQDLFPKYRIKASAREK